MRLTAPRLWLPKSQITRGRIGGDGRTEFTLPLWLAEKAGLARVQGEIPF